MMYNIAQITGNRVESHPRTTAGMAPTRPTQQGAASENAVATDQFMPSIGPDDPAGIYSIQNILNGSQPESHPSVSPQETLTPEEEAMIEDLEARDREVRSHEANHYAQLGQYAVAPPQYSYQIGPDGKAYAVGGSVTASTGPEATPEATARKAQILKMTAAAGGELSAADARIASEAALMQATAFHAVA